MPATSTSTKSHAHYYGNNGYLQLSHRGKEIDFFATKRRMKKVGAAILANEEKNDTTDWSKA